MPNNATQAQRNEVLTEFAVGFRPPARRWDRIFRILPVMERGGDIPVFDKDLYLAPDDIRADGGEANETDIGWKYMPYQCRPHALKAKLTKETRAASRRGQIDVEALKTRAVKEQVDNRIELAVFGPNGVLRKAGNNGYSRDAHADGVSMTNPATASPRTVVNTARVAVKKNCGHSPNTVVATMETFLAVTNTAEFKSQVGFFENIAVTDGVPDKLYGMDTVVVDSQVNTGNKGQSKVPTTFLFGGDMWVGYVADGMEGDEFDAFDGGAVANQVDREILTYGAFLQHEEEVTSWYDPSIKSDWIEYERIYDIKLIALECGGLIQNMLT